MKKFIDFNGRFIYKLNKKNIKYKILRRKKSKFLFYFLFTLANYFNYFWKFQFFIIKVLFQDQI